MTHTLCADISRKGLMPDNTHSLTMGPCLLRLCSAGVERYGRVGQGSYHMGLSCNSVMQWPRTEALRSM